MIGFFARHPTAGNLLMLGFLVMGLFAIPTIQRSTFPDFSEQIVEVRVPYPGATPGDVEEAICRRIENAVESVERVEEIVSEARENVGIVTLKMLEGGDEAVFLSDIKTEVEAISDFPDRAEPPVIKPVQRTDNVVSIAVAGDMAVTTLKAYCEDLKERLLRVPEVSLVTMTGFAQRQIRIEVPATILMQYGISVEQLARVVGAQSIDLPAGTLQTDDFEILLRYTDERRSPLEFEELVVVGGESGGEIRLGDIATITDVFEPEEVKTLYNGHRAGILRIEKTKTQDVLTVFDNVKAFVDKERERAPAGISVALSENMASVVRDRLEMLLRNGWQGLLLVFLVMWLFFGFRYSFWVSMGLPVAFLGAIFFMPLIGLNIDMLTMVALLMALGLMMDDAIVIAESIATEFGAGGDAAAAVVNGVKKVGIGVLSSFLTTCSVFIPLAFVAGKIGTVLRVIPMTLILVLAVSLVEAFLILPHHLKGTVARSRTKPRGRFRTAFDGGVEWVRENVVGRLVDLAVGWRYLTIGIVIAVFLATIGFVRGGHVKFQAFPSIDGDTVMCRLMLPQGTPLARTEAVVARITDALRRVDAEFTPRQPGGVPLLESITVKFNENMDAKEQGPHLATIVGDLLPAETRNARVDEVLSSWRDEVGRIPDVVALSFTEPAVGPAGRPIEIRISGSDLESLERESGLTQEWLSQYRGVVDLMDDLRPGKPEARVRLRPGAHALGFSARDIAVQLRAAFYGETATEIQVGSEDYEVDVRLARSDRNSLADIDYFHVTHPSGRQVPIGTVATVEEARGFSRIARVDRQRTVTVLGDVDTRYANTAEVFAAYQAEVIPGIRERGNDVSLEGEMKEGLQTQKSMVGALGIGLIGVFILLSYQFRSYVEPFTVMMAIPLALIGVVWGHKLMGLELSMPSMMGFASLAGIVVNDSILLVEFIKRWRMTGREVPEAARAASRDRFRAVLLTSLTTIAGLLPLLSESSLQAQVLIPLAASIVFGLLASTLLVLFVVPCLYTILGDFGLVTTVRKESEAG